MSTDKENVFLSKVKDLFDNSIREYCVSRSNDFKLAANSLEEVLLIKRQIARICYFFTVTKAFNTQASYTRDRLQNMG